MGSRVGRILQTLLGVEDMVAELPRTLEDIYVRLRAIEEQVEHLMPAALPRAVCDNCKIDVILPDKNADHALDYIQNIGWTVRDNMTLCPGCTKMREENRVAQLKSCGDELPK